MNDLIEKYLGESKEMGFSKANFMKVIKSGKGLVVYGMGGGYSDTKEFGLTVDQIKKATEKGKVDMLFKNAQMAVKGAKDPKMKGRKFMVRMD
jgi:hypothetical protein